MNQTKTGTDMCHGPLLFKILFFTLPIMLSGILQVFYNAADMIVVGRFVGSTALAAVGSSATIINLIVNLFIGLAVGTSVVVAQYYGAGDDKNVSEVLHTSIGLAAIIGLPATVFSVIFAEKMLAGMGVPSDVLPSATLYLRIFFSGVTASLLFNFGSSALRAAGETKRPMEFLAISGLVNVVLNLVLVVFFHMGVAGVAIATVVSQYLSALFVLLYLRKKEGCLHLKLRNIRIHKDKFKQMLRIGVPASLQGLIFSVSNLLIQSSINTFGKMAIAGNTAASNIDGIIYIGGNAYSHAALSFTGQNIGAKKYRRIGKIFGICILLCTVTGLILGAFAVFFGKGLLGMYAPGEPDVIQYGMIRLSMLGFTYFLCGIMEVTVGSLRGMGSSMLPMLVSVVGVCGFRIAWLFTAFPMFRSMRTLYLSYPISWILTLSIQFACFLYVKKQFIEPEVNSPPDGGENEAPCIPNDGETGIIKDG